MGTFDRRSFLKLAVTSAGAVLVGCDRGEAGAAATRGSSGASNAPPSSPIRIAEWIELGPDGRVVLFVNAVEMGQGARTALAQLLADELDVPWESVSIAWAPNEAKYFGLWGDYTTGGSGSVRGMHERLRKAGATARAMLRAAGAEALAVPVDRVVARDGRVVDDASGRAVSYGDVVERAAALPVPTDVTLKDRKEWRYVGHDVGRVEARALVTGAAEFGLDARVPDARVAAIRHCPLFGGTLAKIDASAATALVPNAVVVELPASVVVVADDTWQAMRAVAALAPEWSGPDGTPADSAALEAALRAKLGTIEGPGVTSVDDARSSRETGDAARSSSETADVAPPSSATRDAAPAPAAVFTLDGEDAATLTTAAVTRRADAKSTVVREYAAPLLAHATMEPMNAIASPRADGGIDIVAPVQNLSNLQREVAKAIGIEPSQVNIRGTLLGGGFGRRLGADYAVEAALVAKKIGAPVRLVWSREEDMRHGLYRPMACARLTATLDAQGRPTGIEADVACIDPNAPVGGLVRVAYDVPTYVRTTAVEARIPIGAWRSVDHSQNTFFLESFLDELAEEAGVDPLAYRRRVLANDARAMRVLDAVAERAGAVPDRHGRGYALVRGFGSYCAQAVDVALDGKAVRVSRVTAAIDCGLAVNPRNIRAQVEGGIVFALTAAAYGDIVVKDGAVTNSNFHDYRLLRMAECPAIDTVVLESPDVPVGGVGEPPVPPLAPALANAIRAAGGERLRTLPIARAGYTLA